MPSRGGRLTAFSPCSPACAWGLRPAACALATFALWVVFPSCLRRQFAPAGSSAAGPDLAAGFACPPSFALSWPSPLGSRVGGGRSLSQVSPSPLSSVSGTSLYCAAILDCPVREGNGRLCHVFPCASLAHTSTTARRCSGPQQRERPVSRPSSGGRKKSTGSCLVPALRSFAPLFSLSLAARWSSRLLPTRLRRVQYRRRLLLGEVFRSPLSTRFTAR